MSDNRIPADQDKSFWYVEARVGSANHRGDCCRFIWDRRSEDGGYVNKSAEDYIRKLWDEIRLLRERLEVRS